MGTLPEILLPLHIAMASSSSSSLHSPNYWPNNETPFPGLKNMLHFSLQSIVGRLERLLILQLLWAF